MVLTPGKRRSSSPPQWDLYEDLLLMAMGVEHLATVGVSPVFRGLFMPSFHRDVCLTVLVCPDGGEVELVALDPLGRTEVMELIGVRTGSEGQPGRRRAPTPPPWRTRASISPERAARFVREVSAIDREALSSSKDGGLDGIQLRGEIAEAGMAFQFSAWSPDASSSPAQHAFFAALYRLAAEVIEDPLARLALEDLHGYLDLGLPVADVGGVPRRVRLFGRLRTWGRRSTRSSASSPGVPGPRRGARRRRPTRSLWRPAWTPGPSSIGSRTRLRPAPRCAGAPLIEGRDLLRVPHVSGREPRCLGTQSGGSPRPSCARDVDRDRVDCA